MRPFLEAAKATFLEIATEEIESQGDKVNVSRLAVMTGLQRRDVMRLSDEGVSKPMLGSIAGRVITQWEQNKRFQTKRGRPRVLTVEGEHNEFKELVRSVSQDLNAGTILFELERIGAVSRTPRGAQLARGSTLLRDNLEEGYLLVSHDMEDLMGAVQENLEGDLSIPHLHARTEYDAIYVDDLPEIREWLIREGSAFQNKVRQYLAGFDEDINPVPGKVAGARVVLGTFSRVVAPQYPELERKVG